MAHYFDRYKSMPELRVATFLDPRFKSRVFEKNDMMSVLHLDRVKRDVKNELQKIKDMEVTSPENTDDPMECLEGATGTAADIDPVFRGFAYNNANGMAYHAYFNMAFPDDSQDMMNTLSQETIVDDEMHRYSRNPVTHPENVDFMDLHMHWWRNHRAEFPNLARVANRVLCAPPSSVESERTFSIGTRVYTSLRAGRLSAANGERMMVLSQNIRYFNFDY